MDKNIIIQELEKQGFKVEYEKRYKNIAWRLKLSNNVAVFCGDKNSVWFAGKEKSTVLDSIDKECLKQSNSKVFIVYGHNKNAKKEIIEMLKSWNLEPLDIGNLPSQGRTIIEQLEHYIPETNFGIVLATPDDEGRERNRKKLKLRARQNVVLELGMLLSKLGRSRVLILLEKCNNFEKPSDISGIMYKEYKKSVNELKSSIEKELRAAGYDIKQRY